MVGTPKARSRYFYEYAICKLISQYNEANPDTRIMVSEGRDLRNQIARITGPLDSAKISTFTAAVNEVLGNRFGSPVYEDGTKNDLLFKEQIVQFTNITGFRTSESDTGYLPISPYDDRFADRDIVRRQGSKLTYMSAGEIGDIDEAADFINGRAVTTWSVRENNGRYYGSKIGVYTCAEDLNGMSRLMQFMSEAEYDSVLPWIEQGNKNFDWSHADARDVRKFAEERRQAIDKSVAILQGLRDMGYPYKITRDSQPGQIQAELVGTRVRIRITETLENQQYVGRVYDNGTMVYFSTTKKFGASTARYENPTPEDCLNLVKFALNQPVQQKGSEKFVGEAGVHTKSIGKRNAQGAWIANKIQNNDTFQSGRIFTAVYGPYPEQNGKDYGNKITIRTDLSNQTMSSTYFRDAEDASAYLETAVATARENYMAQLDAQRIIDEYNVHGNEEGYVPQFSGDTEIATIQQGYWDLLTGRQTELLKPGQTAEEYEEYAGDIGEYRNGTAVEKSLFNAITFDLIYHREDFDSVESIIRQHASDMVDYRIGSYERDADGKRFDPVGVSTYETSAYGVYRNNDDIVAALRATRIDPNELKGNDFYNQVVKDKLIQFDAKSAQPMSQHESPFIQRMFGEIKDSLTRTGCIVNDNDILIDDNGIVSYKAQTFTRQKVNANEEPNIITGQIGQLFIPDEEGKLETKFAGTENYICVPGYRADIVPQKPGETKGVAARTRLRGYEQIMRDEIRYRIRQDVISGRTNVGTPTSCNAVYRRLYDERHPLDFIEQYRQQGMEDDLIHAIIQTEARRVRYDNTIRDGSTINAEYLASNYGDSDLANDNFGDPYSITGGKNMSIMDEDGNGYFDPIATGTSTNQGITRYLTSDAVVGPDGFIQQGDVNGRTPLMEHDVAKYMSYNPFDRQQMTISNLMQASAVTKPVKVAQMTFGGWTQDDPVVVSKKFASSYGIRNHDGVMRDLVIGDKISDLNGNKGVISLVIDPNMDLEEAERQGIREQVEWFRANPDLDIVMAPFPAVSRFNGGSTRELMESPSDLVAPDGTVHQGCMGEMRMIITDKSADIKTHVYDDEDIAQGKGRKVSAQLAWAFNAQGCTHIMEECFGTNSGATANLRELLITMGLDMDEAGNFRTEYKPHEGEVRNVFEMPELKYTPTGILDVKSLRTEFGNKLDKAGGIMEIPFELKYPTGDVIPPLNDGKTDVVTTKDEWERKGYYRTNPKTGEKDIWVKATTVHRRKDDIQRTAGDVTYGIPVLSSYLRSGQQFDDGTSSTHDYTNQYLTIFEQSMRYQDAKLRLADPANANSPKRADWEKIMVQAPLKAQAAYNNITNDVAIREFSGKHNIFRDDLMSHRMPDSATIIWTADPRLDVDEIAIGTAAAESMNIKDGDYTCIWRDPILRDSGARYMKCKIDDSLTGVAISPVMDKCFDGDFDGDTVGLWKPRMAKSKKEALDKLSVGANLLDYGSKREDGLYEIAMQNSLDIKVAQHGRPEIAEHWEDMTKRINEFERLGREGKISADELHDKRNEAVKELSTYYRDAYQNQCGTAIVSYNSMQEHIESLVHGCVETGAKGNMNKIKDYLTYLGVECELNGDKFDYSTLVDHGKSLATAKDMQAVEYATAVKAFGTGVAGKYSQRGIRALRNECPKAVLELTYPNTQGILQAKHDPVDAKHRYEMLMGPCRELWRGRLMEFSEATQSWSTVRDTDGNPVQATTEQWQQQFIDIYTSKAGLDTPINEDYVREVARAMSEDGVVMSIDDSLAMRGSPMDRLAYDGTFFVPENVAADKKMYATASSVVGLAEEGANIFDGKYNSMFAPRVVTVNQGTDARVKYREAHGLDAAEARANFTPIVKGDVKTGVLDRTTVKKSDKIAVGGRSKGDVADTLFGDVVSKHEAPTADTDFGEN